MVHWFNTRRLTDSFRIFGFTLLIGLMMIGVSPAEEARSDCPQPRFTGKAPDKIYKLKNPLEPTAKNLKTGKMLFQVKAKPMPCKMCHGMKGDGKGPMAGGFNPPPRNFTCAKTINGVPDGQLFWIIKNGSPGTGMLSFSGLQDEQIWKIVLHIRQLAQN